MFVVVQADSYYRYRLRANNVVTFIETENQLYELMKTWLTNRISASNHSNKKNPILQIFNLWVSGVTPGKNYLWVDGQKESKFVLQSEHYESDYYRTENERDETFLSFVTEDGNFSLLIVKAEMSLYIKDDSSPDTPDNQQFNQFIVKLVPNL